MPAGASHRLGQVEVLLGSRYAMEQDRGGTPIDFSINDRGNQRVIYNQNRTLISAILTHAFSDDFKISQVARYTHRRTYWDRWMFVGGFLDDDVVDGVQQGHVLGRYYYGSYSGTNKNLAVDNRASGKLATGSIRHDVLAGVDYRRNRERYNDDGDFDATHFPLDIVNPDYDAPLAPVPAHYSGSSRNRQLGFYLQDHITWNDHLTLTLSGRWDRAKSDGELQTAFSPRVGATYEVAPEASLYATWAKSFVPQSVPISGMISLYDLERQNVLTQDPTFRTSRACQAGSVAAVWKRKRKWRPAPGASVNLAYAYIRAKVLEDTDLPIGSELQNIPRHNLSLYGRYVVQRGPLTNLGANLGFLYNSSRNGSPLEQYTYRLPEYVLVDAGLSYALDGWEFQLNGNNIFNKRFFPDSCCLDRVTPGQPRNWRLTLTRHL